MHYQDTIGHRLLHTSIMKIFTTLMKSKNSYIFTQCITYISITHWQHHIVSISRWKQSKVFRDYCVSQGNWACEIVRPVPMYHTLYSHLLDAYCDTATPVNARSFDENNHTVTFIDCNHFLKMKPLNVHVDKQSTAYILTHLPQVLYICVNELGQHWLRWSYAACSAPSHYMNAALLSIGPLGTKFREILIKTQNFSFMKMQLKMSPAKLVAILYRGRSVNITYRALNM